MIHVLDVHVDNWCDQRGEQKEDLTFAFLANLLELEVVERRKNFVHAALRRCLPLNVAYAAVYFCPDVENTTENVAMTRGLGTVHLNLVHLCLEEVQHAVCSLGVQHDFVPERLVESALTAGQLQ